MTYDRLVCANCAAPVNEGRCRVCRAVRQQMEEQERGQGPFAGLNPAMLIALMVLLVAALALLA